MFKICRENKKFDGNCYCNHAVKSMARRGSALVLLVACLPATAFVPAPLHGAWLEPRRRGHGVVSMAKKKPKAAAGAAAAPPPPADGRKAKGEKVKPTEVRRARCVCGGDRARLSARLPRLQTLERLCSGVERH